MRRWREWWLGRGWELYGGGEKERERMRETITEDKLSQHSTNISPYASMFLTKASFDVELCE